MTKTSQMQIVVHGVTLFYKVIANIPKYLIPHQI